MVWRSFLIAAAALKTPTINGHNAQGVNLTFCTLLLIQVGEAQQRLEQALLQALLRNESEGTGTDI